LNPDVEQQEASGSEVTLGGRLTHCPPQHLELLVDPKQALQSPDPVLFCGGGEGGGTHVAWFTHLPDKWSHHDPSYGQQVPSLHTFPELYGQTLSLTHTPEAYGRHDPSQQPE